MPAGEHWTCDNCLAEYQVSVMQIGSRELEHHTCDDCGADLFKAKVALVYIPTKIKSGKPKQAED